MMKVTNIQKHEIVDTRAQTGTFLAFLARTRNGFARHFSREMGREKLREKSADFKPIIGQFWSQFDQYLNNFQNKISHLKMQCAIPSRTHDFLTLENKYSSYYLKKIA